MKFFFASLFFCSVYFYLLFSGNVLLSWANVINSKYKTKKYIDALNYIDTALAQCPDKAEDPYFLHLCGFINYNIYKEIDGQSASSKARPKACDYFIKSINNDNKKQFTALNLKALNSFSISYINDALMILQKSRI